MKIWKVTFFILFQILLNNIISKEDLRYRRIFNGNQSSQIVE